MSMLESVGKEVGIGGLAVLAGGGMPAVGLYLALRGARGVTKEVAKAPPKQSEEQEQPPENRRADVGRQVDETA